MTINSKDKLKIALISKLWEPTSPHSTGGTGAIVGILADGLVARGHDVTVFATGDSNTAAKLISFRKEPWHGDYSEPIEYLNIAEAFNPQHKFDIINSHVEQKACFFAGLTKTPVLIDINYGEFFQDERKVLEHYKELNYIAISSALTQLLPNLNWKGIIHHGIDTSLFPFNEISDDYLLFLGRITPQKGPDIAIEVAKRTGMKLIIAGGIAHADQEYFDTKIKPHVDGKQITYVGRADFPTKIKLFQNAKALLHPINYFEAFGLTLIEAGSCGTPVISFDNGAPKEIIEHGVTGFIVNSIEAMVSAVLEIDKIHRKACNDHIVKNFSADKMIDKYIEMYYSMLQ